RPPRLFRALRRRSQRNRAREADQGLAANQENHPHCFGQSSVERFERGVVRTSSIPTAERLALSNQLNHHPLSHQSCCPLQTRQRDVAFRVKNAIYLRPARLE